MLLTIYGKKNCPFCEKAKKLGAQLEDFRSDFEIFRGQIVSCFAIFDIQSPRQSEIWVPENQRTPFWDDENRVRN